MLRSIAMALVFMSGIGFGIYGAKLPTFPGFACSIMLVAGVMLEVYDAIENTF